MGPIWEKQAGKSEVLGRAANLMAQQAGLKAGKTFGNPLHQRPVVESRYCLHLAKLLEPHYIVLWTMFGKVLGPQMR